MKMIKTKCYSAERRDLIEYTFNEAYIQYIVDIDPVTQGWYSHRNTPPPITIIVLAGRVGWFYSIDSKEELEDKIKFWTVD